MLKLVVFLYYCSMTPFHIFVAALRTYSLGKHSSYLLILSFINFCLFDLIGKERSGPVSSCSVLF
jgi:hypothetical protein